MNGTRTNARRRVNPSASSISSTDSFNENINNAGSNSRNKIGGRRKSNGSKLQGQVGGVVRRKGKNISRIKQMCSKLAQLRILDTVMFIGVVVKLASMLYSRRIPTSSSMREVQSDSSLVEPDDSPSEEMIETLSDKWPVPKWVERWMEHKMPFHSPLLYRREDDDFSFGYDSYLDDDGDARREQRKRKKHTRFRGIFLRDSHFDQNEEQLNSHGYAVVDDLLYEAEHSREETLWAIDNSDFEIDQYLSDDEVEYYYPAFMFRNGQSHPRHYFDDDAESWDPYYSYDDDNIRGTFGMGWGEEVDPTTVSERDVCTTPLHYRTYQPNCNSMHEDLSGYQWLIGEDIYSRRWNKRKHDEPSDKSHLSKYLSHGYYRDAFLFQPSFVSYAGKDQPSNKWEKVVFKTMRHMYRSSGGLSDDEYEVEDDGWSFDPEDKYTFLQYLEDMRKDAMLMELLTSSPRATDIYVHCAMSSVIEFAPVDIEEYILPTTGYTPKRVLRGAKQKDELEGPLNDYISPEEKLEIALEMAKSLAAMHGFEDGAIAHVDVQVGQFFRGSDGFIKIVDYNRAEALLYDVKNEKYCKWTNGKPAQGVYRSPEENVDAPLTEKIDVYSLGNVLYALLTGRLVWNGEGSQGEVSSYDEFDERIVEGETVEIPDIYEELPASELLVRAIKACWTYDVEDRPSIFDLVAFLEQAVERHSK